MVSTHRQRYPAIRTVWITSGTTKDHMMFPLSVDTAVTITLHHHTTRAARERHSNPTKCELEERACGEIPLITSKCRICGTIAKVSSNMLNSVAALANGNSPVN